MLLDSRIDAVTVHRRGAIVTRVAELPASVEGSIAIGPLPLDLDDASVRVSLSTQSDLRATDVRVALLAPAPDEALPPARPEDLAAAEREVARLLDAIESIDRTRRRLRGLGAVVRPTGEPGAEPPPSPAEARIALLSLRDTSLREADAQSRALGAELRAAERTLADLRERERRRTSMRRTEPDELRKVVELRFSGSRGEGPATLRVKYRVDAARWAPTYALRLDRAMERATLEVRAMVAQRTGEDWEGVALALSTASLLAWTELPELASVRIGRRQPRPAKSGWRPPPTGADVLFADHDRARDHDAVPVTPSEAPALLDLMQDLRATAEIPMAPPPQGYAAPMPQAAPMPKALARLDAPASDEMLDFIEDVGEEQMIPVKARGAFGGGMRARLQSRQEAADTVTLEAPSEAALDRAMLDYGRLRLPSVDAPSRGKLVVWSRRELYVEQITMLNVEVNLHAALDRVDAQRAVVLDAALPRAARLRPSGASTTSTARAAASTRRATASSTTSGSRRAKAPRARASWSCRARAATRSASSSSTTRSTRRSSTAPSTCSSEATSS